MLIRYEILPGAKMSIKSPPNLDDIKFSNSLEEEPVRENDVNKENKDEDELEKTKI